MSISTPEARATTHDLPLHEAVQIDAQWWEGQVDAEVLEAHRLALRLGTDKDNTAERAGLKRFIPAFLRRWMQ
jgi:hypothetical protein